MSKTKKTNKLRSTRGLPTIDKLDYQILKLQKATRSTFPSVSKLHIELCRRSPIYYEWHKRAEAESIHWMILALLSLYIMFINGRVLLSLLF